MGSAVEQIADAVLAQSLQDARALSVRAQESAARFHDLVFANAIALQHQGSQGYLGGQLGQDGVEAAYRGNHLKKGSEVDSQEAVAEGGVYKGEAAATLPQMDS